MPREQAGAVICGAGIAGIAAAYFLATQHHLKDILLVDERAPLSLTSDKSTEAYRNWWPGPDNAMIALMNRSIDLLEALAEETHNVFQLNRRGYLYATADPDHREAFKRTAQRAAQQGAGPVRTHCAQPEDPPYVPAGRHGFIDQPDGCDLFLNQNLIQKHFPYLSKRTCAVLHARRCGWFSGQQLGMHLLNRARQQGVTLLQARVEAVKVTNQRVEAVHLRHKDGLKIVPTPIFINAAGPMLPEVGAMLGVDLPISWERHLKVAFQDRLGVMPREAPLLIWDDPQRLPWSEEERMILSETETGAALLDTLPAGVHMRPEGGPESQNILILWPYDLAPVKPVFPLPAAPYFPEVALRGMARMVPGLEAYFKKLPKPFVDGGYYTKTRENRPLIGPLPPEGAFVIGALSGYGLMAACAAGELLAAHVASAPLPAYVAAFALERYEDPHYRRRLDHWGPSGQL